MACLRGFPGQFSGCLIVHYVPYMELSSKCGNFVLQIDTLVKKKMKTCSGKAIVPRPATASGCCGNRGAGSMRAPQRHMWRVRRDAEEDG